MSAVRRATRASMSYSQLTNKPAVVPAVANPDDGI